MSPSNSDVFSTFSLAIHPSVSGLLLIVLGFSSNEEFTSRIFPDKGVIISEADFTDSTAPMVSPA